MSKVYVIGGANLDIFAASYKDLIIKDSNPSKISFEKGGVARNIVENLANFGIPSYFISAISNDAFGKDIKESLEKKGVDFSYSVISKSHPTSVYLAILNKDDMYLGASDMSILEELNPSFLNKLKDVIKEDDYLIFDTNLTIENIEFIVNNLKGIKIVDAISANKAIKLNSVLNKLDVLKVNKLELNALNPNIDDLNTQITSVIDKGVKKLLVTGKDELYVVDKNSTKHYKHNNYNPNPVNVTGAGDALLSGYTYGLINNLNELDRVKFAFASAILTVEVNSAVRDLNSQMVFNKVKEIEVNLL